MSLFDSLKIATSTGAENGQKIISNERPTLSRELLRLNNGGDACSQFHKGKQKMNK